MSNDMQPLETYLDYRRYLGDYYATQKRRDPSFSHRLFAARVGVKAPYFLLWLIEGKRNLGRATIPRVAAALGLSGRQEDYFEALVLFNQASVMAEKTRWFERLRELRGSSPAARLTEAQYEHYRHWYNEAIRETLLIEPFDPREKWAYRKLARRVSPAITESQARTAIRTLLRLGLAREGPDGLITIGEPLITTGDEVRSFFVKTFHQGMIGLAAESMDRYDPGERDVSGVTLAVSDRCFEQIKKEVQLFRKRILELVAMDTTPTRVYQYNTQLFPLTPGSRTEGENA